MDSNTPIHDALLDPSLIEEMRKECEEAGLIFDDDEELIEFLNEVLTYGSPEGEFNVPEHVDRDEDEFDDEYDDEDELEPTEQES
jgi:hypothetical protein